MRLLTTAQAKKVDELAQEAYGLSQEQLMEAAGAAVAEEVHLIIGNKRKKILVLVGPGNNGADGFVAARILKRKGFTDVHCVLVEEQSKNRTSIWEKQKQNVIAQQLKVEKFSESRLYFSVAEADIIIDAIYGIGFRGNLSKELLELIQFINEKNKIVVAVDVPTGLNANTGSGLAIRAKLTVTFGLVKPGFLIHHGPRFTGRIKIYSIGFPKNLLSSQSFTHFAFGAKAASKTLPKRKMDQHKGDFGRVHIFAGSQSFPGAGVLCATAAGRAGAGYVYLYSFSNIYSELIKIPEVIARSASEFDFSTKLKRTHSEVFVVGPGLGLTSDTAKVIRELKKYKADNVLLDADAITVCAEEKLWPLPNSWIMTPHVGELSRMIGLSVDEIENDRFSALALAIRKYNCTVLLKGHHSIVAQMSDEESTDDGVIKNIIVLSGNVTLAKGGTGDILSGFIGALMAQGLKPSIAASLGAYLHGRLADEWIKNGKDVITLLPSDLAQNFPELVKCIRDGVRQN